MIYVWMYLRACTQVDAMAPWMKIVLQTGGELHFHEYIREFSSPLRCACNIYDEIGS